MRSFLVRLVIRFPLRDVAVREVSINANQFQSVFVPPHLDPD